MLQEVGRRAGAKLGLHAAAGIAAPPPLIHCSPSHNPPSHPARPRCRLRRRPAHHAGSKQLSEASQPAVPAMLLKRQRAASALPMHAMCESVANPKPQHLEHPAPSPLAPNA